jgi:shikimate kinase
MGVDARCVEARNWGGKSVTLVMNIALIGYRGTGKTAVARQLARNLGWDWVDADVEVELAAGRSIAAIFADDGEPAFRDLEAAVLSDLIQRDHAILALGGGVVLRSGNRSLIRQAGRVVWLMATPATIAARLAADATTASRRPNLTVAGGLDEIRRMMDERAPFYRQCSDLEIDTEAKAPAEVATEILEKLSSTEAPA